MPLVLKRKHYPWVVTDPDWNKRPGWMVIAAQELAEPRDGSSDPAEWHLAYCID